MYEDSPIRYHSPNKGQSEGKCERLRDKDDDQSLRYQLEILIKTASVLEDVWRTFEEKIVPVMGPENLCKEESKVERDPTTYLSPVGAEVMRAYRQLGYLATRIEQARNRVQL